MRKILTYEIKYKPYNCLFWRRIKDVLEDGIIENTTIRFFTNIKGERIELDMQNIQLIFSKERVEVIEELNRLAKEKSGVK